MKCFIMYHATRLFMCRYCGSDLSDQPGRDPELDKGRDGSLGNMLNCYQRTNLERGDGKWGDLQVLVSVCCSVLCYQLDIVHHDTRCMTQLGVGIGLGAMQHGVPF